MPESDEQRALSESPTLNGIGDATSGLAWYGIANGLRCAAAISFNG